MLRRVLVVMDSELLLLNFELLRVQSMKSFESLDFEDRSRKATAKA